MPAARAAAPRLMPSRALARASRRLPTRPSRSRRAWARSSAGVRSFVIDTATMTSTPARHPCPANWQAVVPGQDFLRPVLYAWEFEKDGHELKVCVEGQLIFNTTAQILNAALAGLGLAYVPEGMAQPYLARGRLKRVLEDWCLPYPGYHLWYPSRRQSSAAFALVVDALRFRDTPQAVQKF